MNTYLVNLIPLGSIIEFPDSQRIFGSICWAIKDIYGDKILEELLDSFYEHQNRFLISSSYPEGLVKAPIEAWVSNEEKEDMFNNIEDNVSGINNLKSLKKIEYITMDILKDYLNGTLDKKEVFKSILQNNDESKYRITDRILHNKVEKIEDVSLRIIKGKRNTINRITNSTDTEGNLFYFNRGFMKKDRKLNFFIKTDNIEFFKPLFRYMSDSGIGSDKSVGMNNFKVELNGEYEIKNNIGRKLLISKYIPYYEEIDWDKSYFKLDFTNYKIESRFNLKDANVLKDRIGYLCEGAVLNLKEDKEIYGQLPIVKEVNNKKIRHSGLGFLI